MRSRRSANGLRIADMSWGMSKGSLIPPGKHPHSPRLLNCCLIYGTLCSDNETNGAASMQLSHRTLARRILCHLPTSSGGRWGVVISRRCVRINLQRSNHLAPQKLVVKLLLTETTSGGTVDGTRGVRLRNEAQDINASPWSSWNLRPSFDFLGVPLCALCRAILP